MREIGLGGFHQVRDQVMAALELHIDLGESISIEVTRTDEAVVLRHDEQPQQQDDRDDPADNDQKH